MTKLPRIRTVQPLLGRFSVKKSALAILTGYARTVGGCSLISRRRRFPRYHCGCVLGICLFPFGDVGLGRGGRRFDFDRHGRRSRRHPQQRWRNGWRFRRHVRGCWRFAAHDGGWDRRRGGICADRCWRHLGFGRDPGHQHMEPVQTRRRRGRHAGMFGMGRSRCWWGLPVRLQSSGCLYGQCYLSGRRCMPGGLWRFVMHGQHRLHLGQELRHSLQGKQVLQQLHQLRRRQL